VITTLEERKINLLSQIKKLKKEIDGLRWLEYKGLTSYRYTVGVRYPGSDTLQENSRN